MPQEFASCLYEGWVQHRRRAPFEHEFRYELFMIYLDLAEVDEIFRGSSIWSTSRPALAWFRREDHFGDPTEPLDVCVRNLVEVRTGRRPTGPVRLLTHLRYFGYVMNPISLFYCFDRDGERVEAVVAEVQNTPWNERHCYVLEEPIRGPSEPRPVVEKDFHVSPFMPMNRRYEWRLTRPSKSLGVTIESFDGDERVFDATLGLVRRPLTRSNRLRSLVKFPAVTAKVFAAIYWQALRLWWRGAVYHPHPRTTRTEAGESAATAQDGGDAATLVESAATVSHRVPEEMEHGVDASATILP